MNISPFNETKLSVRVIPNASKNEILGLTDGVWRVKIAAPPDKGKANKELIEFFSKRLGLKKDKVSILKGHTSHSKLIAIEGKTQQEISQKFSLTQTI
jgi:uncharacterized protein (TIGR00251 family)